jgi:hypothetical protein
LGLRAHIGNPVITCRLLGPVLIVLALCLISLVVYTFFDGIAPALGLQTFSLSVSIALDFIHIVMPRRSTTLSAAVVYCFIGGHLDSDKPVVQLWR